MPRDIGTGLYHYPDGTPGNPAQTIFSTRYNTFINDLANTMNQKLPINMGGTDADNATDARDNLDAEVASVVVTNYDSHVFESGSFWSAAGATGAPTAETYAGVCIKLNDVSTVIKAFRHADGATYSRTRISGVWGAWVLEGDDKVSVAGDTMTGDLTISKADAQLQLRKPASGTSVAVTGYTGTNPRWAVYLGDSTAESGVDAGSDFTLRAFGDGGGVVGNALFVSRKNLTATFGGSIVGANNFTIGTAPASGIRTDGTNIEIRAYGSNGIYFSSESAGVNYGSFGTTGLSVKGPMECTVPVGNAFVSTTVTSVRTWATGTASNGHFWIYDVGSGNPLMTADPATAKAIFRIGINVVDNNDRWNGGVIVVSAGGYKPGGGVWSDSSDRRIKNVLGPYEHGLAEIMQVNPVRYTFKGNFSVLAPAADQKNTHHAVLDKEFVGVIAQEIEVPMPETVTEITGYIDGQQADDVRILDANALTYALINAVKTLTARIEALEAAQAVP